MMFSILFTTNDLVRNKIHPTSIIIYWLQGELIIYTFLVHGLVQIGDDSDGNHNEAMSRMHRVSRVAGAADSEDICSSLVLYVWNYSDKPLPCLRLPTLQPSAVGMPDITAQNMQCMKDKFRLSVHTKSMEKQLSSFSLCAGLQELPLRSTDAIHHLCCFFFFDTSGLAAQLCLICFLCVRLLLVYQLDVC
ncbi:uncharacterized protein LOC124649531 isoform X2 [Lolium rigidum]|uniref:uncharacterized protein LOC124649531 isoform X2 n=1 Tax=Lolium rigidum TaxID=89674 RepID=UPI001F5CED4C|nr:uncharacterized protein LOC124649531 isoform X2 [Lolium rigidum]